MKLKHILLSPLLLSLLVHGVFAVVLYVSPAFSPDKLHPQKLNQVELIDPDQLLAKIKNDPSLLSKGQIVEQDENPLNDEIPKDSKYLSRHNQKVVKETQAANQGKFNNAAEAAGEKQRKKTAGTPEDPQEVVEKKPTDAKPMPKADLAKEDTREFLASDDGIRVHSHPTMKDLTPSFKPHLPPVEDENLAEGGGRGASASDDHLKDVPKGMQTMLSTREFVYYTYYNRIKDKLRQYWEPKIKEKMERIMRQGRQLASAQERITRVVIVLDGRGTLIRVQVIGPSGVTDLDDAAAEAFRAAAPFPNPPKGIVESDGTIKIRWDFILEA